MAKKVNSDSTPASQKTPGRWLARAECLFACVVTASAVVQCHVTQEQLASMAKSINQTDAVIDLMKREQRPWLLPAYANADFDLASDPAQLGVTLKNYGTQPAIISAFRIAACLGSKEADIQQGIAVAKSRLIPYHIVVPQGSDCPMVPADIKPLDPDTVANIRSGITTLYFVVVVEYTDPLKQPFSTTYAIRYDRELKQFTSTPSHSEFR